MDAKTTLRQTLLEVEKELGALFFEREEEIRGLICALLCREHVLLLGPPGAAKSELAQELCSRISGAPYFRVQLTRTSTPEELFGPVSLKALEQDSYRRKTTSGSMWRRVGKRSTSTRPKSLLPIATRVVVPPISTPTNKPGSISPF